MAELKYELLNPVEVFRVSSREVEIGKEVAISYRLAYLPPCCTCMYVCMYSYYIALMNCMCVCIFLCMKVLCAIRASAYTVNC